MNCIVWTDIEGNKVATHTHTPLPLCIMLIFKSVSSVIMCMYVCMSKVRCMAGSVWMAIEVVLKGVLYSVDGCPHNVFPQTHTHTHTHTRNHNIYYMDGRWSWANWHWTIPTTHMQVKKMSLINLERSKWQFQRKKKKYKVQLSKERKKYKFLYGRNLSRVTCQILRLIPSLRSYYSRC